MESSDEDDFEDDSMCKYGAQLPQFEADEIMSKKPIQVEDMIVKDENGRRRFHGAFTGGFSAGYWNTVGSKEGFTPKEFKSSRFEKASLKQFTPTDFMDEEDLGEFGIAPQKIQTKEDFGTAAASGSKRKREKPSDGPIPGDPVLKNLLKPVRDKAAVRILKSMGWRDNQGIGSRMTYREKKRANERNRREMYIQKGITNEDLNSDEDYSDEEITFAPDDFDPYIMNMKDNSFGLGYSGLRPSTNQKSQHVNLFQTFVGRDNKKFTISGTAFGVGALEEEDDDIYAMDDLSNYDRTLEGETSKLNNKKAVKSSFDASLLEGFQKATISDCQVRVFSVDVPRNFNPRNWLQRKSRFEPLNKSRAEELEAKNKHKKLGLGRHDLKPDERGALLNEKETEKKDLLPPPPTASSDVDENKRKEEAARKISELLNSKQFVSENNETFKPFIANPEKQARYENFLALKSSDEKEIEKLLNDIQPLSMKSFDREMEKKEFIQAKKMYQPLDSIMASRFIKEADAVKEQEIPKKIQNGKEIVVLQRTTTMWKPHKNLCKRFNVPEPFGGMMFDEEEENRKKKQSSSLFDFIGIPLNTKSNFVAPQVIPRKLTEDTRQKNDEEERRKKFLEAIEKEKTFMGSGTQQRATAKDFFENDGKKEENNKTLEVRKEPEAPKTELEKKVAESINKKPEEKKDLFKAIFCDSEDDEDDEEVNVDVNSSTKNDEILSEQKKSKFIESFLNTKSAVEINILRNKSPPRGIFKGIFDMPSTSKKRDEEITNEGDENEFYGPKMPTNLPAPPTTQVVTNEVTLSSSGSSSSDNSDLDEKLLKKLKKSKKEKWVEKDKVKKSKKEKKKKKKSHKKHKSKR